VRPLQAWGCVQIAAHLGCTPCMDPKTASRCKVAHLCASRSSRSFTAVGNGGAACESTGASGRCCTARTWPSLQLMDPAQKIVRQTRHRAAAAAGVTSEGMFSSLSRIFTGTKRQCGFPAIWAAFMSPIPRMAMAGLGGGVDVDFRSPAGTAPHSQTGVGEPRDGDAPGGWSRVMCHGE